MVVSFSDIVALCSLVNEIASRLKNGPEEVEELGHQVVLLSFAIEALQERLGFLNNAQDPRHELIKTKEAYINTLLTHAKNCFYTIQTFVEENRGYDANNGARRVWNIIRAGWNRDEVDQFQMRILIYTDNINTLNGFLFADQFVPSPKNLEVQDAIAAVIGKIFKATASLETQPCSEKTENVRFIQLDEALKSSTLSKEEISANQQAINTIVNKLRRKPMNILIYDGTRTGRKFALTCLPNFSMVLIFKQISLVCSNRSCKRSLKVIWLRSMKTLSLKSQFVHGISIGTVERKLQRCQIRFSPMGKFS